MHNWRGFEPFCVDKQRKNETSEKLHLLEFCLNN